MLLDRSNIRKWLKARKFEIENNTEVVALTANAKLSSQRVITFGLVGGKGHYKDYVTLRAMMKWNKGSLSYHSIPQLVFHFYLPIAHEHLDRNFKMMIKWTEFAFEEYKNKRLTL